MQGSGICDFWPLSTGLGRGGSLASVLMSQGKHGKPLGGGRNGGPSTCRAPELHGAPKSGPVVLESLLILDLARQIHTEARQLGLGSPGPLSTPPASPVKGVLARCEWPGTYRGSAYR